MDGVTDTLFAITVICLVLLIGIFFYALYRAVLDRNANCYKPLGPIAHMMSIEYREDGLYVTGKLTDEGAAWVRRRDADFLGLSIGYDLKGETCFEANIFATRSTSNLDK